MTYLRKVLAGDKVVRLEEYLSQAALARRIVLEVETIETVERVVRVHVECVDAKVVGIEAQRLENLQRKVGIGVVRAVDNNDTKLGSTTKHVVWSMSTCISSRLEATSQHAFILAKEDINQTFSRRGTAPIVCNINRSPR